MSVHFRFLKRNPRFHHTNSIREQFSKKKKTENIYIGNNCLKCIWQEEYKERDTI